MLLGVVLWAATQLAESSSKENIVALAFIEVLRLRNVLPSVATVGVKLTGGNPVETLGGEPCSRTANFPARAKKLPGEALGTNGGFPERDLSGSQPRRRQ